MAHFHIFTLVVLCLRNVDTQRVFLLEVDHWMLNVIRICLSLSQTPVPCSAPTVICNPTIPSLDKRCNGFSQSGLNGFALILDCEFP